jgi:hypothetical protein
MNGNNNKRIKTNEKSITSHSHFLFLDLAIYTHTFFTIVYSN